MDSDESYHSESDFYHPDEMANDNEKENINVDVFTMTNVQNYILA